MTENKQRLTAIEGVEQQMEKRIENNGNYIEHAPRQRREWISDLYERAVWIDSNISNSCAVDPFFTFHFYDEEDAMAFKLRWTDAG